jgi:hypothetical protein
MTDVEKRASRLISETCHSNPLVFGKNSGPWAGMPFDKAVAKLTKIDEDLKAELQAIIKSARDKAAKEKAVYPKRTASDWAYIQKLKRIGIIKDVRRHE